MYSVRYWNKIFEFFVFKNEVIGTNGLMNTKIDENYVIDKAKTVQRSDITENDSSFTYVSMPGAE